MSHDFSRFQRNLFCKQMTKPCHDGEFLLQHFFDKCYQNYRETKKYHGISCKVKIQGVKEPGKSFPRFQFCFGR